MRLKSFGFTYSLLLKLIVSVGLLSILASKLDISSTFGKLTQADPVCLLAATALLLIQAVCAANRWRCILLDVLGRHYSLVQTMAWNGMGTLLGQVMPSTVGGDVYRLSVLANDAGWKPALRSVLLDRMLGLTFLGAVSTVGIALLTAAGNFASILLFPLFMGLAGLALCTALYRWPGTPKNSITRWRPLQPCVVVGCDLRSLLNGANRAALVGLSITIHGLSVVAVLVLCWALGWHEALTWRFAAILPAVLLFSALPISIGGWGVREGAMALAADFVGIPAANGFVLSLLFGTTLLLVSAGCSLLWLCVVGKQSTPKQNQKEKTDDQTIFD